MCSQRTLLPYADVAPKSDSIPVIYFLKYSIPTLGLFLVTRLGTKLSSMTSQRRAISTLMMVTS